MNKIINASFKSESVIVFYMALLFTLTLTPLTIYPFELTAPILTFTLLSSIWFFMRMAGKKVSISFSSWIVPIIGLTILVSICFTETEFNIWTIHFLNFIIFYLIVVIEKSKGNFSDNILGTIFFIVLSVEVLKTILLWIFPESVTPYLINENIRGMFAVLCLPLVLKKENIWIRIISILHVLFLVLVSESRTALIGLTFIGLFLAFKYVNKIGKRKLLIGTMMLLGLGLSVFNLQRLNLNKKESTEGREIIWKNTIQLIQKQSIIGSGLGSYQKVFADQLSSYFSQPRTIAEKDNFKYQISIA